MSIATFSKRKQYFETVWDIVDVVWNVPMLEIERN